MNIMTAHRIRAEILSTLNRNTAIALEANTHFGGRGLTSAELDLLHEACAANLAQIFADRILDEDDPNCSHGTMSCRCPDDEKRPGEFADRTRQIDPNT